MKIENKKISDTRVKLTINTTEEETAADYKTITGNYLKNSNIPGFRRGKAPMQVVMKRYGEEITNRVNSHFVQRFIREAAESEKLNVVGVVDVENVIFSPSTGISFVVTLDTKPEFKLPKYQNLSISVKDTSVSDEDFEKQYRQFRNSYGKSEETEEAAKDGDYLEVSFEATAGGKPFENLPEEGQRFVKSEKFWLVAGDKPEYEAIPTSGKAMVGLKKDDDFKFDVKFPSDFSVEALRKVKATYTGKVLGVRALTPPSDEELMKICNADSIDKVKADFRKRMEEQKDAEEDERLYREIEEALVKKADFEVPASVVQETATNIFSEVAQTEARGQKDVNEYVTKNIDAIRKKTTEKAEELVRLQYIAEGIAKEQSITISKAEVDAEISTLAYYMSMRNPKAPAPEKLREQIEDAGRMPFLEAEILKRKVIQWIIKDLRKAK